MEDLFFFSWHIRFLVSFGRMSVRHKLIPQTDLRSDEEGAKMDRTPL